MRLAYAIPADAAEVGANGKVSMLGGEFERIVVPDVPAIQTRLALVIKLFVEPEEAESEHRLRIRIVGPQRDLILPELVTPFVPHAGPTASGDRRQIHYLFALNFPMLVFPDLGTYAFQIFADDVRLGEVRLQVASLPAASQNQAGDMAS